MAFTCPCCHAYSTFTPIEFDECDYDDEKNPCHIKWTSPINIVNDANIYQYIYLCKNPDCQSIILRECLGFQDNPKKTIPLEFKRQNFWDFPHIVQISKSFPTLYQQSYKAEQLGCSDISWAWYRKAIEFLIKDYIINSNLSTKEEIQKKSVSQCINEFIDDKKIKELSKRAFWLWNDQVHYYQERNDMDLDDLKNIIKLVMLYIESDLSSKEYFDKLPDKKEKNSDQRVLLKP